MTQELEFPHDGRFAFECSFGQGTVGFVWIDDHQVCDAGAYMNSKYDRSSMDGSPEYPLVVSQYENNNTRAHVRAHIWTNQTGNSLSLDVKWRICSGTWYGNCTAPESSIPSAALSPTIPLLEQATKTNSHHSDGRCGFSCLGNTPMQARLILMCENDSPALSRTKGKLTSF